MRVADAHCDTLTEYKNNPFYSEKAHWSLDKFKSVRGILQYFAIYTDEELCSDSAFRFAANAIGNFYAKKNDKITHLERKIDFDYSKINILISLEGASPIINNIYNLYAFHKLGVRAMTLTWNHRNFVGDGVDNCYGLTQFGKEVIAEMEKLSWIVDVSHLNTAGFDDVCKLKTRPFMVSHSNSYTIHQHRRNLYDEQIKEIIKRNGFIGINFYSEFIGYENSDLKMMFLKHIEHIIRLGGDKVLGFGGDFDGITSSPFDNVLAYQEIEILLREKLSLDEDLIKRIMYKNLLEFTLKSLPD